MDGRDFRSIGRSAQEELWRRALYLIEHAGLTQAKAAPVVGVQRQAVNLWLRRYRAEGDDGVLDGRRVSPRRGKGLLTEAEAQQVNSWIVGKTPIVACTAKRVSKSMISAVSNRGQMRFVFYDQRCQAEGLPDRR